MKKTSILCLSLLSFLFSQSQVRYLAGELKGINEAPVPVTSAARGTVIATYNTETNVLELKGDFQKLSDTVSAAHIHPGGPGVVNNPIITLNITPFDSTGTISLDTTLTDFTEEQEAQLLAGNMYVNVHSKAFQGGEIRAQLIATTSGTTRFFDVNLTQSPGNATGDAWIVVDSTTRSTYVTGTFQGINSNVTTSHIHLGRAGAGTLGRQIFPLTVVQRAAVPHSGTFSGSSDTLSKSSIDSMMIGLTYVDVHSTNFPTQPAIAAQLGDQVLPVKLSYLNAYKQRNNIELVWETLEELNVSRYEVEQLNTTTKQWTIKGTVPANGGNSASKYSFTDVPNTYGSQYMIYRLKMIDKDGKSSYSYLVKVNYEKLKAELFIQTNPVVNGELKYIITGLSAGKKGEVSIIDYNGRLVLRNTMSSLMNNTLRIQHLSAGMYKLVIRVDDNVMHRSFIK